MLQVAFIMFHWVHHYDNYDPWHYTSYNVVTLAILIVGIICTYDLRRALGVNSLATEAPLLGQPAIV